MSKGNNDLQYLSGIVWGQCSFFLKKCIFSKDALFKSDSKDIYNVIKTFQINAVLLNARFIKEF